MYKWKRNGEQGTARYCSFTKCAQKDLLTSLRSKTWSHFIKVWTFSICERRKIHKGFFSGFARDSQARFKKDSTEEIAVERDVRLEITEDQKRRDVEQIRIDRLRVTVAGHKQRRVECGQEPNSSAFAHRTPLPSSVVSAAQLTPSTSSSASTELDVLRQERDRYKRKCLAAKKALTRAQDSLRRGYA